MNIYNIKLHIDYKKRIKDLYRDGFTVEELGLMYGIPWAEVKRITQGITQTERV